MRSLRRLFTEVLPRVRKKLGGTARVELEAATN